VFLGGPFPFSVRFSVFNQHKCSPQIPFPLPQVPSSHSLSFAGPLGARRV
jgi:hypothetical protein